MTPAFSEKQLERFFRNIDKRRTDGCWIWRGPIHTSGRGLFNAKINGKRQWFMVHRLTLAFAGKSIQAYTRNTCENPLCCNPDHFTQARGKPFLPLVPTEPEAYNSRTGSLVLGNPFLGALAPLRHGTPVLLTLTLPAPKGRKMVSAPKPIPVYIQPFGVGGAPKGTLLVSLIGKGSCLVNPRDSRTSIANLVLAWMPAELAKTLMEMLHRTLQE